MSIRTTLLTAAAAGVSFVIAWAQPPTPEQPTTPELPTASEPPATPRMPTVPKPPPTKPEQPTALEPQDTPPYPAPADPENTPPYPAPASEPQQMPDDPGPTTPPAAPQPAAAPTAPEGTDPPPSQATSFWIQRTVDADGNILSERRIPVVETAVQMPSDRTPGAADGGDERIPTPRAPVYTAPLSPLGLPLAVAPAVPVVQPAPQSEADRQRSEMERRIQGRIDDLKRTIAATHSEEREEAVARLRVALGQQYDLRMEQYDAQLKEMEEKLAEMREKLQRRRDAKDRLVELRAGTIVYETTEGVAWPSGSPGSSPFGGFFGGGPRSAARGLFFDERHVAPPKRAVPEPPAAPATAAPSGRPLPAPARSS